MPPYDEVFVDRFLAPWNRHDVDGALALMTEDCIWEVTRGSEPHGTLFEGQAAVRSAIADAFKALPDVHYQPIRSSFSEDHVVVELLVTGTLPDGTGVDPVRWTVGDLGRFGLLEHLRLVGDWG